MVYQLAQLKILLNINIGDTYNGSFRSLRTEGANRDATVKF